MQQESLATTVTVVVPEFPSGEEALNCTYREKIKDRTIQYTLLSGTICIVHLPGTCTKVWYPESENGWYLKIKGQINLCDLEFLLSFLELYKMEFRRNSSEIRLDSLESLGTGVACENCSSLQGALVAALVLRVTQERLGPQECARCRVIQKRVFQKLRYILRETLLKAKGWK